MIYDALRKVNFFGFLWIMSLAAIGAWLGVMVNDDQMPIEYLEEGAKILPDPVEDGGRVLVHLRIRYHRYCPGTSSRILRSAETGKVLATYDPIPAGAGLAIGDTMSSKTFELPPGLNGPIKYQARVCFQCNLWQTFRPICTDAPDLFFRVVPAKTSPPVQHQ